MRALLVVGSDERGVLLADGLFDGSGPLKVQKDEGRKGGKWWW